MTTITEAIMETIKSERLDPTRSHLDPSHQVARESYPDVLEAAADILESEQVAWCQGTYFNRGGGHLIDHVFSACALGAIRLAVTDGQWRDLDALELGANAPKWVFDVEDDIDELLTSYLDLHHPTFMETSEGHVVESWGSVAGFNDHGERTREQVVEALKGAAKWIRNGETT